MKILKMSVWMCLMVGMALAEGLMIEELTASKDSFGRTNMRNRNSGGTPFMLMASFPGVVSLAGFDLSTITNEIVSAEFSFRIQEDFRAPLSFTVASMVHHEKNTEWGEGTGSQGVNGRLAVEGESTYQWRAFRDRSWKDVEGRSVRNLNDDKLWNEIENFSSVDWVAGNWITVKMQDAAFIEAIRASEFQMVTFGMWGTGGNGAYKMDSKESGHAPKLTLQTKEIPKIPENE